MNAHILKQPVITEKSLLLANTQNIFTFEVAATANKNQVREAIETVFSVKVIGIRTIVNQKNAVRTGKRRMKTLQGKVKKALITLREGDTISFFDLA